MGNSSTASSNNNDLKIEDCVNTNCPWSKLPVSASSLTLYNGNVVGFCNTGCRDKFEKAIKHFDVKIQEKKQSQSNQKQQEEQKEANDNGENDDNEKGSRKDQGLTSSNN